MQVLVYDLSLSLSFKFLAIREQLSERAHPLSTYSLHTLALALRAGLLLLKIPPWRAAIDRATPSRNATSTKTQTPTRRRSDSSRVDFVSHSLAVLCRRPRRRRSWPNVPSSVASCCWLKDRLILASSRQSAGIRSQMEFCSHLLTATYNYWLLVIINYSLSFWLEAQCSESSAICSTLTLEARHHYGNTDTQMLVVKCKHFSHVISLKTTSKVILLIHLELFCFSLNPRLPPARHRCCCCAFTPVSRSCPLPLTFQSNQTWTGEEALLFY